MTTEEITSEEIKALPNWELLSAFAWANGRMWEDRATDVDARILKEVRDELTRRLTECGFLTKEETE